jgi:hypothetical protein
MSTKKTTKKSQRQKLRHEGAVLISVLDSCKITGLGSSLSYKLVREGTIPTVWLHGRRYIHRPKLLAWLDALNNTGSAA